MTMKRAYMDHNATAPVRAEAADAVLRALSVTGNPSSVHAEGRAARKILEEARASVATLVHAKPAEVVFTSGGTEAANLALHVARAALGVERVIVSAIEHDCVRAAANALDIPVEVLSVDANGVADLGELARRLAEPGKALVALMYANNETGVIQPVAEAVALAKDAGALVLTDTIQAWGRLPVDFHALGADMMTVSAHKLGGPQGVGALVIREGLPFDALIRGGGQELRRRSGTENVPGIAGFGAAARLVVQEIAEMPRVRQLRDRLEEILRDAVPGFSVFGAGAERLANTSLFSAPGLDAETFLMTLDLDGFAVSAGSACSSGKVTRSHVLAAMGIEDALAKGAIRVSLGLGNTAEEVERLAQSWSRAARRARDKTKSSNSDGARAAFEEVES